MPSPTELAYFAGFFDGEGCVTIAHSVSRGYTYGPRVIPAGYVRYWLFVQVTNTNRAVLEDMKVAFGGQTLSAERRRKPHHQLCYRWQASGTRAASFLRAVRPYLRVKSEQTDVALTFQSTKDYRRMTPQTLAERETFKRRLMALKHPGAPVAAAL